MPRPLGHTVAKPQFADRTRWVTCNECQGRSFSDPTKAYHYPECSKYREWRFGRLEKVVGHAIPERDRILIDAVLEDLYRETEDEEW